jgi:hypothetical protein
VSGLKEAGMYMYPIEIDYNPKVIKYTEDHIIDEKRIYTLESLKSYVADGEKFYLTSIDSDGSAFSDSQIILSVCKERIESSEELAERIKKEEKYMENYNKFHSKK